MKGTKARMKAMPMVQITHTRGANTRMFLLPTISPSFAPTGVIMATPRVANTENRETYCIAFMELRMGDRMVFMAMPEKVIASIRQQQPAMAMVFLAFGRGIATIGAAC